MSKNQIAHLIHQSNLEQPKETVFTIINSYRDIGNWKNYKVSIQQVAGKKVSGRVLLKVKDSVSDSLRKGDSYVGFLRFNELVRDAFSYKFNYNKYLLHQGITHQAWVNSEDLILLPDKGNKFLKFISSLQIQLNRSLKNQVLDSKVIQLTQALVLGNKKELDKELSNNFARAGVIHILAISGLHIGIIYMVFVGLFKQILYSYKYRLIRSVLILLILWGFAWFSGASSSALRATTMFSCFEISRLLLRRQHALNSLFLSVFILFLVDPKIIFSVGFQLSITAVASIIIGVPKVRLLWKPKSLIGKYIWGIICVSLCAQIGLLPLSVYYFHQIPTLFLVANIPVMICIPFVMGFAILIVIGGYFEILPQFVLEGYNFMILQLISFVNWVASFKTFVLQDLYISAVTVFGCYLFFTFLRWWYGNFKRGLKYLSIPISCILAFGFMEINRGAFKKEVWLLNNYKNTSIVEVSPTKVTVFSEKQFTKKDMFFSIKPMMNQLHRAKESYYDLKQVYRIKEKNILIVNQDFIPNINLAIDIIILSNSPKINVSRLLQKFQPKKMIIASNNNFFMREKWKSTFKQMNYDYYSVDKQGSLRLNMF